MKKALVVDGNYLAHRAGRVGEVENLVTKDGYPTGVIFGVLRSLFSYLDNVKFDRVVFVTDAGKSARRKALFPGYKIREEMGADEVDEQGRSYIDRFYMQMDKLAELLPQLRVRFAKLARREGDDLCYQIGQILHDDGFHVTYMSDDHDFPQLLNYQANCEIFRAMAGKTITHANAQEHYGVPVEWLLTLKAMVGDGSDKIPSIADQAGEKTYIGLIQEAIRQHALPELMTKDVIKGLVDTREEWFDPSIHKFQKWRLNNIKPEGGVQFELNREIMDLRAEEFSDEEMSYMRSAALDPVSPFNVTNLIKEFTTLEFKSLSQYLVKPTFKLLS